MSCDKNLFLLGGINVNSVDKIVYGCCQRSFCSIISLSLQCFVNISLEPCEHLGIANANFHARKKI